MTDKAMKKICFVLPEYSRKPGGRWHEGSLRICEYSRGGGLQSYYLLLAADLSQAVPYA